MQGSLARPPCRARPVHSLMHDVKHAGEQIAVRSRLAPQSRRLFLCSCALPSPLLPASLPVAQGSGTKRQCEEEDPGLVLGLDDLFAAYRRIPNADSMQFGIVGIYNLELEAVVWHEVKGLPFGLSSAPSIFNRVPALLCVLARNWCGVAVDQFVDDYVCVDRDDSPHHQSRSWRPSALEQQRSMGSL